MSYSRRLATYTILSLCSNVLGAIGPVTDLHIVNADIAPDGYTRAAVLAEGVFPGPLISGNKGDNFQINVINKLTNHTMLETTSIHWHGLYQAGTNWADGTAMVTQCPIASGNSFLYDYSVPDQAGTFWYHSHLSTQYCDGLRGPLVVYDPNDPYASEYDVDDESTIITLADWYHVAASLEPAFPTVDSNLINGLGPGADIATSNLSVITIESGKRYRFRLLDMACDPNYIFTIDGHKNLTIIEADGVNTEVLPLVDSIQIFAGQRYSFILNADQPVDNYWIRTMASNGPPGLAILRYSGAPDVQPTTQQTNSTNPLLETSLHALVNATAPGADTLDGADLSLTMSVDLEGETFYMNNVTFIPPSVPVLLQILSGAQSATDLLPSGSVYVLPGNSVIQITMPGVPGPGHPFHLHGHTFSVIRSAGNSTVNFANPVQRDTVNIGGFGDEVTIRFVTDNSGPWFLHCHNDWHLQAGLAVVMAEDVGATATVDAPPAAWSSLCPVYSALPSSSY